MDSEFAVVAHFAQSVPNQIADYGSLPFAIGASVRQRRRPCMPRTGTRGRCHNRHSMLCCTCSRGIVVVP
jgi:hypothetical protein